MCGQKQERLSVAQLIPGTKSDPFRSCTCANQFAFFPLYVTGQDTFQTDVSVEVKLFSVFFFFNPPVFLNNIFNPFNGMHVKASALKGNIRKWMIFVFCWIKWFDDGLNWHYCNFNWTHTYTHTCNSCRGTQNLESFVFNMLPCWILFFLSIVTGCGWR